MRRAERNPRSDRLSQTLAALILCLGLILATYPAWSVMMLGKEPTLEELLSIVCGRGRSELSPQADPVSDPQPDPGPPAWIRRLLSRR